jgi:signal transduction histidine kinase
VATADQVGGWAGAVPRLRARVPATAARRFLAVAIVPMTAVSVWLALGGERDDRVTFAVEDDGIGFDPSAVADGTGLTNLADRVAAVRAVGGAGFEPA